MVEQLDPLLSNYETQVQITPWLICQGGDFLMLSIWGGEPSKRHLWKLVSEIESTELFRNHQLLY